MIHQNSGRVSAEISMTGTKIVLQRQNAIVCSQGDGWIFGNASKRWSQRRWAMSSFPIFPYKIRQTTWSTRMRMYHYISLLNTIWQVFIPPDASGINAHGFVMLALQCHGCKGSDLICFRSLLSGRTMKYYEGPSAKGTADAGRSFHAYDDISGYRSICALERVICSFGPTTHCFNKWKLTSWNNCMSWFTGLLSKRTRRFKLFAFSWACAHLAWEKTHFFMARWDTKRDNRHIVTESVRGVGWRK